MNLHFRSFVNKNPTLPFCKFINLSIYKYTLWSNSGAQQLSRDQRFKIIKNHNTTEFFNIMIMFSPILFVKISTHFNISGKMCSKKEATCLKYTVFLNLKGKWDQIKTGLKLSYQQLSVNSYDNHNNVDNSVKVTNCRMTVDKTCYLGMVK